MDTRHIYYTDKNYKICLEPKPINRGGEGSIFRIQSSGASGKVAKIYKNKSTARHHKDRIQVMINNVNMNSNNTYMSVAWPISSLYKNNEFCGFLMDEVLGKTNTKPDELTHLCNYNSNVFNQPIWNRFKNGLDTSISLRLGVTYNLAAAIKTLHETNKIVIVDLKPQNILFDPAVGQVIIIDTDSFQIISKGYHFYASAITPEFAPPEYQLNPRLFQSNLIDKTWDYFSFGIIAYRLLLGIHPFSGSFNRKYSNVTSIEGAIKNGMYANGKNRKYYRIVPKPHYYFGQLPQDIQRLFNYCFDHGYSDPSKRPSLDDWISVLSEVIASSSQKQYKKINISGSTRIKGNNGRTGNTNNINHNLNNIHTPVIKSLSTKISERSLVINWRTIPHVRAVYLNGKKITNNGSIIKELKPKVYKVDAIDINGIIDRHYIKVINAGNNKWYSSSSIDSIIPKNNKNIKSKLKNIISQLFNNTTTNSVT